MAENLNTAQKAILDLMEYAPLQNINTALDLGMGSGWLSKWMADKGKKVIGTVYRRTLYQSFDKEIINDIDIVECIAQDLPFRDDSLDCVVMSHVLEHCPNVGNALQEVCRVLKEAGYLFIFVPPQSKLVIAGHVSTGWNVGQLIYTLLINGFDVKDGNFIEYGGNVCGFVQKSSEPLPQLHYDFLDIQTLHEAGKFPRPIVSQDGRNDCYYGYLDCANWRWLEIFAKEADKGKFRRIIKFFPKKLRCELGLFLWKIGKFLFMSANQNPKIMGDKPPGSKIIYNDYGTTNNK